MKYFHTALAVSSIDTSLKFYERVFGFKPKTQGERFELGVRFVMLEDRDSDTAIELFEHDSPKTLCEDLMDFQQIGIKHVAFVVDSIEPVIEKALQSGGEVIWEPTKGVTVKRIAFISDPDGIPIELVEL